MILTSSITKISLILFISYLPVICTAKCAPDTIIDLAKQGNTHNAIAQSCNMSVNDVTTVLNNPQITPQNGLPAGSAVGQCGCWGPVNPQMQQPVPQCQSGYAVPQNCNALCPAGGYMWRGVCG